MVTRCHSLSLIVPLVVIHCHSLSLIVIRCTTRCRSLYHSLSLVVTRRTTRLSFYKRSQPRMLFTCSCKVKNIYCFVNWKLLKIKIFLFFRKLRYNYVYLKMKKKLFHSWIVSLHSVRWAKITIIGFNQSAYRDSN